GREAAPMSAEGSVTRWIARLQSGDEEAARVLWDRYFRPLVGLARKRLQGTALGAEDEQVALSAFDSFCRGARAGRFPDLAGRDNLWGLLITITVRKAADLVQHEHRRKRHPGRDAAGPDVERLAGREPSPEFAAQVAEEFDGLLARLPKPDRQAGAP